jgi:phage host-nuclease inhibitor protein Gam
LLVCVQGDDSRAVFKFTPLIAPVKATVFPLLQKQQLNEQASLISKELTAAGLSNIIDTTGGQLLLQGVSLWAVRDTSVCVADGERVLNMVRQLLGRVFAAACTVPST